MIPLLLCLPVPGWYDVQLRLTDPQSPPYSILLRGPRASAFKPYYAFLVTSPGGLNATVAFNQAASLTDAWKVFSATADQAQPLRLQISALSLGRVIGNVTLNVTRLLDPTVASLAGLLAQAQGGNLTQPVVGSLSTLLLPSVAWNVPVAFKVRLHQHRYEASHQPRSAHAMLTA